MKLLQVTMEVYVSRFNWDIAKFPLRQPIPGIVDGISKVLVAVFTGTSCFHVSGGSNERHRHSEMRIITSVV